MSPRREPVQRRNGHAAAVEAVEGVPGGDELEPLLHFESLSTPGDPANVGDTHAFGLRPSEGHGFLLLVDRPHLSEPRPQPERDLTCSTGKIE